MAIEKREVEAMIAEFDGKSGCTMIFFFGFTWLVIAMTIFRCSDFEKRTQALEKINVQNSKGN